jgi:hypothetical protein
MDTNNKKFKKVKNSTKKLSRIPFVKIERMDAKEIQRVISIDLDKERDMNRVVDIDLDNEEKGRVVKINLDSILSSA